MNNAENTAITEYRELSLSEIVDRIAAAKNALIICHMNPDGDTVGSASALYELILACCGSATIACHDEIPRRLRFLTKEGAVITPPVSTEEFDTVFSIDVASPAQLGDLSLVIDKIDFMIDHHAMGEVFADYYIDPAASAAGEIVFSIYEELKSRGIIGENPEAARRMYAAIVSDTGSFKFSNTTEDTHKIAASLLSEINSAEDSGASTTDLCRKLFGQRTLNELYAQMHAIQNLRFYEDGALGVVMFTTEMLEAAGLSETDIGNAVETPRGVEGVLVGISIRQLSSDPTKYKVSSRANAEIDVAAVCAKFDGGGHVRAAGCTITAESPEDALAVVVDAFGEAVRNYRIEENKN